MKKQQVFKYIATNQAGDKAKGKLFAQNSQAAAQFLTQFKLIPLSIKPINQWLAWSNIFFLLLLEFFGGRKRYKYLLIRQMRDMLNAHYTAMQILSTLALSTHNLLRKQRLFNALSMLVEGYPFSQSLQKYLTIFNTTEISVIRQGESFANLKMSFNGLFEYLENTTKSTNTLVLWVIPLISGIIATIIVSIYFNQEFMGSYNYAVWALHLTVPPNVQLFKLLFTDNSFVRMLVMATIVITTLLLLKFAMRTHPPLRNIIEKGLIQIPIIGESIRLRYMIQFTSILALSLKTFASFQESVAIAGNALKHSPYQKDIIQLVSAIHHGFDPQVELTRCKLFSKPDLVFLKSGLVTNDLQEAANSILYFSTSKGNLRRALMNNLIRGTLLIILIGLIILLASTALDVFMNIL